MNDIKHLLLALLPAVVAAHGCSNDGPSSGPFTGGIDTIKVLRQPGAVYVGSYEWDSAPVTFEEATGLAPIIRMVPPRCLGGTEGQALDPDLACLQALDDQVLWILGLELKELPQTIDQLIAGAIDADLEAVADVVSEWGRPVLWTYQREPSFQFPGFGPSGDDFVWSYDGDRVGLYGDPNILDGAERYVALQRHLHDVVEARIRAQGRTINITWVQGAIIAPDTETYTLYYVGNEYVDWHAVDVYFGYSEEGPTDCHATWQSDVSARWSQAMTLAPDKPVLITEFGVSAGTCNRVPFFEDFFAAAADPSFANLAGFLYWQADDPPAWTCYLGSVGSDPATDAWRTELAENPGRWATCVELSDGQTIPAGCR